MSALDIDLSSDLGVDQRRRLHILLAVLSKSAPDVAIETAARMECFVLSGTSRPAQSIEAPPPSVTDKIDRPGKESRIDFAPTMVSDVDAPVGASSETSFMCGNGQHAPAENSDQYAKSEAHVTHTTERKAALDAEQRAEFKNAIASGANNGELAVRFGLTRRQAHGVRIGLGRSKGNGLPRKQEDVPGASASSATDRNEQDNFLRTKVMPTPTLDDVVRFLRQLGDIVVKNDRHYIVNHTMQLTPEELVMRANKKKTARGKPPFHIESA